MRQNYLTIEDAALQIGVTTARVHQWIADGQVEPYRPHSRACLLTQAQVNRLKRIPKARQGRPRVSD
jgi:hypothetical protein